jgi:hypothetical protein
MKNEIRTTAIVLTVLLLSAVTTIAQDHNHMHKSDKSMEKNQTMDMKSIDKNNDGVVYECPMKCEAPLDKPGECSKCGMNLKKISVNDMSDKQNNMSGCMSGKSKSGSGNKSVEMDHSKMEKNGMHHSKTEIHNVHKGTIDVTKIDMNKDGKVFQDMMDWNVISDKAGDCPVCGMTLKEVTVEDAVKNLNKHGFKTK